MEQDMFQQPSTEETEGGTTEPLPKESLAIYQEPEASEHLKPVNNMATTRNESFCLKLPLFEHLSTNQTPLETERATRPKSVFTSSSLDTSPVLHGIMSSLLEGFVQNESLIYPINDLSLD
jgi:hypothetical protein